MLKTRVITALILVAVLLPSIFFLPALAWALLGVAIVAVAGWEWGRLLGISGPAQILCGVLLALPCLLLTVFHPEAVGSGGGFPAAGWPLAQLIYPLALLIWFLLVPAWIVRRWPRPALLPGLLLGLFLLVPTWLALVQLRALGPWVLLGVMAIAWVADIAAYFTGRAFGKRKLAPAISPGKTWAGAWGAVGGVIIYGLLVAQWLPASVQPSLPVLLLILLALTVLSIVGDLFESLLKRQAGIKDSSNILPGHGGILDRIDSLTSTMPMVALVWLYLAQHPTVS